MPKRIAAVLVGLIAVGTVVAAVALSGLLRGDEDRVPSVGRFEDGGEAKSPTIARWKLSSARLGKTMEEVALVPSGSTRGRPLLIDLHGRGAGTPGKNPYSTQVKALVDNGAKAPVIVMASDNGNSYWHDRRDGAWGSYILSDVIPSAIKRFRLDPSKVAISGLSMGGSGALHLAQRKPQQFCAVSVHSPALWLSGGESAPGAYDDAADFAKNDPLGPIRKGSDTTFKSIPVWVDGGDEDPFLNATNALVEALKSQGARVTAHRWRGGHNGQYWGAHQAAYINWLTARLVECDLRNGRRGG